MAEDVLHHDDGGIHHQPEVDGAHRQQIGRFASDHHEPDGEGQRKRDGHGDDDGAAHVAEECPLQQENQHYSLHHVVQHGVGGEVDEIAAVVDPLDAHARRQYAAGIDLLDLGFNPLDGGHAFGAAPHEHDALHDVVRLIRAGDAEARQIADGDLGHVADEHRCPLDVGDQGLADLLGGVDQPHPPHHRRLLAEIDGLAADIDVGVAQCGQHLRHRQSVTDQLALIDGDVVGLGLAAPAGDVDHAGDGLEAPLQHPILEGLEVRDRIIVRSDHPISVDLADGTGGRNLRLRTVREGAELRQTVGHPLLGLLIGEVVGELHLDVGQAEQRYGADGLQIRDTGHLDLERYGDVALDLLGRLSRALGDDVHQRGHRIGVGLDVQHLEAGHAGGQHHHQQHHDQNALPQREGDDRVHVDAGTAA